MLLQFRSWPSRLGVHLLLVLIVVPFAAPLAAVVAGANGGFGIIENIKTVAMVPEVPAYLGGSLLVAIGTVLPSLAVSLLCAYALARLPHKGKPLIQGLMVAALALPSVSIIVPLFYVVSTLNLANSYLSVIVPLVALGIPFNVILARSFLEDLPKELFEAASLDGCNSFQTLIYIVIPVSRPLIGVIVVWTFIAAWNEFLLPLVFLLNPARGVVTLLPSYFQGEYSSNVPLVITASLFGLVPSVIMFLAAQRFFAHGLSAGMLR